MSSQPWVATDDASSPAAGEVEWSDAVLLDALRLGDQGALDVVIRRYWTPLVSYLTRVLESPDLAEDVAQRTYCQLWDRRTRWRREGSLRGLLFRVARNFAISERRRRIVEQRSALLQRTAGANAPTPAELFEDQQLRMTLERAIRRLPERRREVFVLRCMHDLSYKEIAEIMRISTQTVANQLSHALATLRRDLADLLDG
jgi:RNA polymerase sigma-70 factor, ECF subfamily